MTLRERIAFFGQMRRHFQHTGAVQPSSRYLARAMAAPLRRRRTSGAGNARILEIGPGTGAVTRAIAAAMGPEDELVCYEINAEFARFLQQSLADDPAFAAVADRVRVHVAPAQQLERGDGFDVAVCSAPLNNFDAATIDAILAAMIGALRAGGEATLFEYALFPALRRALQHGDKGRSLRQAEAAKRAWLHRHGNGTTLVLRNLPPARVHELQAAPAAG